MAKLSNLIRAFGNGTAPTKQITSEWEAYLKSGAWDDNTHDDGYYHPSQLAGCPALLFLAMEGMLPKRKEGDDPKGFRIFRNGDGVHERIQRDLCDIGLLDVSMLDDTEETPIEIPEYNIRGHCDGVLNFGLRKLWKARTTHNPFTLFGRAVNQWKHLSTKDRGVLEIKSINARGFALVSKEGPKPEHKLQANIYCKALDIPRAIFIYENKDNQEWYEKSVNYDPALWKQVADTITMVEGWRKEFRKTGKIPAEVKKVAAESAKDRKPWGIYAIDFLKTRLGEKSIEERHHQTKQLVNKLLRRKHG